MQSVSSVILKSTDGAGYGVGLGKRTVVCDGDPPRLMFLSTRHNLLRAESCAKFGPGRTRLRALWELSCQIGELPLWLSRITL